MDGKMTILQPSTRETRTTLELRSDRAKKRECERLSRQRRAAKLEKMRCTVNQPKRFVIVAPTLQDNDAVWDIILDAKTCRTRRSLIKIFQLVQEIQLLQLQQTQLQHLLKEHQLSTTTIINVFNDQFDDNWDAKVEYFRELANKHFQPWTIDACREEFDAACKEANVFQWTTKKQTTNLHVLGWRENQRFDRRCGTFQFEYYKDFQGLEITNSVNATWDTFTHRETYFDIVMRPIQRWSFENLQQLGPNMVITRVQNRYPGVLEDIHVICLVSRLRTTSGYVQCVRSLHCPELMRVLTGPSDMWSTNKFWFQWDRFPDNTMGYTFRIGGILSAPDPNYGQNWMAKMFGAVLRLDNMITGRHLVTSE